MKMRSGFESILKKGAPRFYFIVLDYLRVYLLSYDVLPTNLVPEDMNVPKLSLNYVEAGYKIKLFYFGLLSSVASNGQILKANKTDQGFSTHQL